MIEALLIEGVTKVVVEAGMDHLGRGGGGSQDLAPVISALHGLNEQSESILTALSRPTETAGVELCERAATAYANGWYDDALTDAQKSIDTYPYSAKPRLIGGLAALALNRGDAGLELLISAVKYSANGQPDVGALSGVLAAHLAAAVGGSKLALSVIADADKVTGGNCPAVVSTLVRLRPNDAAAMKRLRSLWWAEHQASDSTPLTIAENLKSAAQSTSTEYSPSGAALGAYLAELAKVADDATRQLRSAKTLGEQLHTALSKPPLDADTRKTLSCAANIRVGWLDAPTPRSVLKACMGKPGVSARPVGPAMPTIDDLKALREYAQHTESASAFVLKVLKELPEIAARPSTSAPNRAIIERVVPKRAELDTVFTDIRKLSATLSSHKVFDAWQKLTTMIESVDEQPVLHLNGLTTEVWKAVGQLPASGRSARPDRRSLRSGTPTA